MLRSEREMIGRKARSSSCPTTRAGSSAGGSLNTGAIRATHAVRTSSGLRLSRRSRPPGRRSSSEKSISPHRILFGGSSGSKLPSGRAERVAALARNANLDVHADRLLFPDTTVLFVHAAADGLAAFAERVPGAITEIRRATGTIEPFLDRGTGGLGQHDWVAELADASAATWRTPRSSARSIPA